MDIVNQKRAVNFSMQTQSVRYSRKQEYAGNNLVERDTLKHVGMEQSVIEENHADSCIICQFVIVVNSLPRTDIIVSFVRKTFVQDAHLRKHMKTIFMLATKTLNVSTSTND